MAGSWATLAFLIFGFIILAYLLLQIYDRLRQDARQPVEAAPQLRSGVDEMVRELRQAAEQINADMTLRANTLQRLVDDANEAMKRLDAAAQRASTPARHGRAAAPRPSGRAVAELPEESARRRAEAGTRDGAVAGRAGTASRERAPIGETPNRTAARERALGDAATQPASPQPTAARRSAPPPPLDRGPWPGAPAGSPSVQIPRVVAASPAAASAYRQSSSPDPFVGVDLTDTGRFQTVRRLADQGMSAAEIARSISLGREEVELIMRVSGEAAS